MSQHPEIRLLTPDERAELKRLAEAATPGPWVVVPAIGSPPNSDGSWPNTDRAKWSQHCGVEQGDEHGRDASSIFYADSKHVGAILQDADYIAAVSPDLTLGTLAYVEQQEARIESLVADRKKAWDEQAMEGQRAARLAGEAVVSARKLEAAEARVSSLQKELADQEVQMLDLVRELRIQADALILARNALSNCYDVTDYPASGQSTQDVALRAVEACFTPAPVSPSSQDPAGAPLSAGKLAAFGYEEPVPTYDEFIRLATADEPVWVPTLDTWDQLTDQGKRNMMQVADLKPRELKAQPHSAAAAPQGEETRREEGRADG